MREAPDPVHPSVLAYLKMRGLLRPVPSVPYEDQRPLSKPKASIRLEEARRLADQGVQELI